MSHQIKREHRLRQADDILTNNGDLDELNDAVSQLHQQYMTMTS